MKKFKRLLPVYIIVLFIVCCCVLVGIFFNANQNYTGSYSKKTILQVKMTNDNGDHVTYHKLLADGKIINNAKFSVKNEEIVDAKSVFKDHTKNNKIYLTVGKYSLQNQHKKKVSDPVYDRMIMQVAREQKHPIFNFRMFKVNGHYYAFLSLNAGLDDSGIIYRYSFKNKKMVKIGQTSDDNEVLAVKE